MDADNHSKSFRASARAGLKRLYFETPVQGAVLKLISPWRPAPWQSATMEFDYGVWLGPSSLRCEDGRQLGEENTWPKLFRRHVATEYNVTRMPGSRQGLQINMTALHMVMRAWDEALALMGGMRAAFDRLFASSGQALTLEHLFILSKAGCALPALLARRSEAVHGDGQIPALVATQFKLIAGFFMVAQHRLWSEHAEPTALNDGATFFDYADRHEIFTSPSGRACGGSRRKIIELYDFIQGPASQHSDELLKQFAAPEQLFDYAVHSVHLELTLLRLQREVRAAYLELAQSEDAPCEQRAAQIAALKKTQGIDQVLALLETAALSTPLNTEPAETLRERVGALAPSPRTKAERQSHHDLLLEPVRQYGLQTQSVIHGILGAPRKFVLTDDQVAARLGLAGLLKH